MRPLDPRVVLVGDLAQKAAMNGFVASASCHVPATVAPALPALEHA